MSKINWKAPRTRNLILSYMKDWLLVLLMTAVFFAIDKIAPYHRKFSIQDKTIMFPYAVEETIPVWLLLIICFVVPIVTMSLVSIGIKHSLHDFHSGLLGLCLGLSMTIMITDIIKITAGRARPDMLDRCQPPPDVTDPVYGLLDYTVCTTPSDSAIMIDGFKSFPSGHSSFSFAGLGFLSFYLGGKIRMFDERGHTWKGFVFAAPLAGAILVAISRTRDYRHHWQDVLVGGLLGLCSAYFAYRQYHPALGHIKCCTPFASRFPVTDNNGSYNVLDNSETTLYNRNLDPETGRSVPLKGIDTNPSLPQGQYRSEDPFIDHSGSSTQQ
ncbi:phosphatidic acid phosphatase type 2/haloperoxidase [Phycomyces nitens]|nr:phosphatidic acid phosphatase type 2/haloperoxidase [Phycomyces nitens]